jgi:ornithine--oxo-acid transaminase
MTTMTTKNPVDLENVFGAHNYHPLPVTLARGKGVYVWDTSGKRYIDMMSAYSAVSHGHCHPRLVAALTRQARTLAVVSRAFHTELLGPFVELACKLTGFDQALPMNSGAEAVETALKAARKWAYTVKGVPNDRAEIIACRGNFHGRTIAIVSMSSEAQYRDGFGPMVPGFKLIPYADSAALEAAITPNTAAFIVEPIQGEGGIIVPPPGYLSECARICRKHNVLLICDEIQTGLGRTGALLASQHEGIAPDAITLGKALGGGLLPVSMFLARREVMNVFTPGDHGSTFGGNPLAAAVGLEALKILQEGELIRNAAASGAYFIDKLRTLKSPLIRDVRGKGLLIGVELDIAQVSARAVCERMIAAGILSKDTHESVIRFAPPLVVTTRQIDRAIATLKKVLSGLRRPKPGK